MAKYPNKPNLPAVVKPTQAVQPNQVVKAAGLVKAPRPPTPPGAVATYDDSPRYKFGFGVASASSGRIYKISFDVSRLCWMCSCPGCIGHQKTCKHLKACGLQGPDGPKQIAFAKKHGFLG